MDKKEILKYVKKMDKCIECGDDYVTLRSELAKTEYKNVFSQEIETEDENIRIVPIGDVHFGHKNCDIEAFQKTIKYINEHDNVYTFLIGDLLETATKKSIGAGVFEEDYHLDKQMKMMLDMLIPLARNGKILGGVEGNHEDRIYQLTSLSPIAQLCTLLDVPFQKNQMYFLLTLNGIEYKIFVAHGKGGGASKSTKIKNVSKPGDIAPMMDLYITGHFHSDITDKDKVFYVDGDGILQEHIRRFVMCGSFLRYFDGYPEQSLLAPSIVGAPEIILFSNYKNISVLN